MISLEVREPKVYGEIEWISVRIHGQSFMLHQIVRLPLLPLADAQRKMMSLAMLACRTDSPPSLIAETFGPKRIHVPKAPPLGLLLQQPQFKSYNERIKQKIGGMQEDRDPVDFTVYAELMETFKVKWIYERLRQDELETNIFQKWIRQVDCSSSPAFSFLK
jgi:tRNA pseudouridine38-40 synthase